MALGRSRRSNTSSRRESLLQHKQRNSSCSSKCCQGFLLLFPLNGCVFILFALYSLTSVLEVPIDEASVSRCIADFPEPDVLHTMLYIGASCIFVTAILRNIQFSVYQRRAEDSSCVWKGVNIVATISLIFAYIGFVILVVYDVDENYEYHSVGAFTYFILSNLFGLIHALMLWKQTHYPIYTKLIFTLIPLVTLFCSIYYLVSLNEIGLVEGPKTEYEWFAIASTALLVGCVAILFTIDPVDDELKDFLCCQSGRRNASVPKRRAIQTSWESF